jgi:hypothetical protein
VIDAPPASIICEQTLEPPPEVPQDASKNQPQVVSARRPVSAGIGRSVSVAPLWAGAQAGPTCLNSPQHVSAPSKSSGRVRRSSTVASPTHPFRSCPRARRSPCSVDRTQRRDGVASAHNMRRVGARTDDDKVVPRDFCAGRSMAFRHELRLRIRVVHEHKVGVAMCGGRQRLAGALCKNMHLDPGLARELRQDVREQATVLHRGGGREHDSLR